MIFRIFLLMVLAFSSQSYAYDCVGKVNNVVLNGAGIVTVSFGNINWVYLCSVSSQYNGVTPEACKSMLSVIIAAKMGDKNIQMWFDDKSNDCTNTSHPAWAELKSWYFGPALV